MNKKKLAAYCFLGATILGSAGHWLATGTLPDLDAIVTALKAVLGGG